MLEGLVERSDSGHVITDSKLATSAVGIFAAGTLRHGAGGRAAAAAGEGVSAALAASEFLGENA